MEPTTYGDLVKVGGGGPELDGIVFETPSATKVVVAVADPSRGPVFRTVHPSVLSERADEAPGDKALRLLIKRTPPPVRRGVRGGGSAGRGLPAHTRPANHRSTG